MGFTLKCGHMELVVKRGKKRYNLPMLRTIQLFIIGMMACVLCLGGCTDPLFPKKALRSPYQRHSELRGKDRGGAYEADPANPMKMSRDLRRRLAPLE